MSAPGAPAEGYDPDVGPEGPAAAEPGAYGGVVVPPVDPGLVGVQMFDPSTNTPLGYASPDEAAQLYLSGRATFRADQQVPIQTRDGIKVVSGSEAGAYLQSSASITGGLASQAQYQRQEEAREFDSPLLAGAAAAARGASLGFSDPLLVGVGGEGVRRQLAGLAEYNPTASLVGEGAGMVAPLLFTGGGSAAARGALGAGRAAEGASMLGRAAEVASAVPRGISGLGGLIEGKVLARAGEGALARIGAGAASAATEGALYGLGSAISQATLTNTDLTAEQVIASMRHGAILGGALGGGIAGLGVVGRGVMRRGEDTIASLFKRGTPEAQAGAEVAAAAGVKPPLTDSTAESYIKLVSKGNTEQAAALREAWRDRQRLIGKSEDTLETAQRSLRKDIDEALEIERTFTAEAKGRLKVEQVKKAVKTGNEDEAISFVQSKLEGIKSAIGEMQRDPLLYGRQAQLKELRQHVARTESNISKAVGEAEQNAVAFAELDYLKRKMGKYARPGAYASDTADASTGVIRNLYEGLRGDLENAAIWGKAAEDQKAINAIWARQLDSGSLFKSRFATAVGRDEVDAFMTKWGVDPAKISGYVNGFGRAANDLNHEVLTKHVANTKELIETISKHYDLGAKSAELARAQKAVGEFDKTLKLVEGDVKATNALKRLQEEEKGHVFGQLGGITGLAMDAVNRPVHTLQRMAELEEVAGRVTKKLQLDVGSFFGKAKATAAEGAEGAATSVLGAVKRGASRAAETGRAAALPTAMAVDRAVQRADARKPIKSQYDAQTAKLSGFLAAPNAKLGQVAAQLSGAPPGVVQAVQAKAMTAAQFLQGKLPQRAPQPTLTPQLQKSEPSPVEMATYLRYARAVDDPLSVLDDAKAGRVTREGAEALRTVYPQMYAQLQGMVMQQVATLEKPLSYAQALQMSILLDLPTDPSLAPAAIARQQKAYQDGAALAQAAGGPAPAGKSQGPTNPIDIAGTLAPRGSKLERTAS